MPYKFQTDKIKLPRKFDARYKLTDKQKIKIKELYLTGKYSQRELAGKYNVSRRLIVFCIYPERLKKMQEDKKKSKYHLKAYDKERHTKYMKKHRRRKQVILKQNNIIS